MKLVDPQCGELTTDLYWFAYLTSMVTLSRLSPDRRQGIDAGTCRVGEKFQLGPVPGVWAC